MRNEESDSQVNYWVITQSEDALGPYEDYASAYIAATVNFGMEGWTITTT